MHRTTLMLHVWNMWTVCRCSYCVCGRMCTSMLKCLLTVCFWGVKMLRYCMRGRKQEMYMDAKMDCFLLCREWTQRCRHWPAQFGDHTPSHYQTDNWPGESLTHIQNCVKSATVSCWWIMIQHVHLRIHEIKKVFLYVFCRTSMQYWTLLLMPWIGWTMLSGIPSWCSWILTVSRAWRTWGPDCVQSPGRVPGNSMSVHSNWERTTTTYSQVNTDVLRLCFLYWKKNGKDWERQWELVQMQT